MYVLSYEGVVWGSPPRLSLPTGVSLICGLLEGTLANYKNHVYKHVSLVSYKLEVKKIGLRWEISEYVKTKTESLHSFKQILAWAED